MKRSLFIAFILVGPFFNVGAQDVRTAGASEEESVHKGAVLLGAYFNFSLSTVTKTRVNRIDTQSDVTRIGLNLNGGKMLSDHWGLLLSVGYLESNATTPVTFSGKSYTFEDNTSNYVISPSIRYYKLISEATYFFVQGTASISRGTADSDELDDNNNIVHLNFNTRGWAVNISPGFSYFMTKKLSTEISIGILGYSVFNGEDGKGNQTETKTFQTLLYLNSVSLGFVFYL
ncbi:MAG TPA: hypothetical protein PLR06_00705 [Cyclobacteriaceae bacterium]|nr:hypothetical protein [Cyclobacteriaceae bacterium]